MRKKFFSRKVMLVLAIALSFFLNRGDNFLVLADEDANDIQEKLDKTLDKKEAVEQELNSAQARLQKNQTQLNTTKNLLEKTESEMERKEKEIENLNQRIYFNQKILENYLQELYYESLDPLLEIILGEEKMNDVLFASDQMFSVKEKSLQIIFEIRKTREEVDMVKKELEEKADDHEKLVSIQQGQQYEIKSDIRQAESSLSELNAKINKLRGELSSLLGSSVSFKNVIDAAKFAAKVTGIRKDYLLGVLVVESNLGRYTGGCNFKESRMSGTRAAIFKDICKELDYNYNKQKVSCPPSGYKGTGGAMGVAQFMPDTWKAYKSRIANVTGHNPPDPWNLTDGVVAMALKLTQVSGVTSHKKSAEAKAYCIYLAGGNWAAYCDSKGVNYGEKVLYWADNYEKLMD